MGFDPWHLQYLFTLAILALTVCLSLPINGTNWAEDLKGWSAADWGVLAALGSALNIGANLAMQYACWMVGAPTVAMFVGLRLVLAIALSKLVLGVTIIETAVQVRWGRAPLPWLQVQLQVPGTANQGPDPHLPFPRPLDANRSLASASRLRL